MGEKILYYNDLLSFKAKDILTCETNMPKC